MGNGARRVAIACVLGGAMLGLGMVAHPTPALASCDLSYPDFCIQPPYEVGDLDCIDIGVGGFTVYQPDPHYFDADYDGIGCESW